MRKLIHIVGTPDRDFLHSLDDLLNRRDRCPQRLLGELEVDAAAGNCRRITRFMPSTWLLIACVAGTACAAHDKLDELDLGAVQQALSPPGTIGAIETNNIFGDDTTPGGTVFYARTAPRSASETHRWWLRLDVRITNGGGIPFSVTSFDIDTNASTPESKPLDAAVSISGGSSKTIVVPGGVVGSGAFPTMLTVKAFVAGYNNPMVKNVPLARFDSDTPSNGYLFPLRPSELGVNHYNAVTVHANSENQKWAYDIGGRRWNGSSWSNKINDLVDGSQNSHFIVWDQSIYAMSAGTIRRCVRSIADNVVGATTEGGGNTLIIEHANGEWASYHHLKQNSISVAICPSEGPSGANEFPLNVPVAEGQYLGRIGNSGHSDGPHLHVQITGEPPSPTTFTERSLPLNFYGMTVHNHDGYNPDIDFGSWYAVPANNAAALYSNMLMLNTW
jgi:hypothetical protein